jgi:UDP-N-acetylglucosamine 1-carboxyvinyltransferase
MDKIRIQGGRTLEGKIEASGAKNAALPILASCLLTEEPLRLLRVPDLRDVGTMLQLLAHLGVEHEREPDGSLTVRWRGEDGSTAPYDLVKTMRASILVLGPALARRGRARVSLPGGCAIGARPVDLHLQAMEQLGAEVAIVHGYIEARCNHLKGGTVEFPSVTVTGTENVLMAASLARGSTEIRNAACEPEVVALAEALRSMGAEIEGEGTPTITVQGVPQLHSSLVEIIPDRIEAGTYLVAGAITGGRVSVKGCRPEHMSALLERLEEAGIGVERSQEGVHVWRPGGLRPIEVDTAPYPGFPTDMQAQLMALMTQADGTSRITETIFENRFLHAVELQRMGAEIHLEGTTARIEGPRALQGAEVMATDLRASACLVLAGLAAAGETLVHRVYHLDRGYDGLDRKLRSLGAQVERLKE